MEKDVEYLPSQTRDAKLAEPSVPHTEEPTEIRTDAANSLRRAYPFVLRAGLFSLMNGLVLYLWATEYILPTSVNIPVPFAPPVAFKLSPIDIDSPWIVRQLDMVFHIGVAIVVYALTKIVANSLADQAFSHHERPPSATGRRPTVAQRFNPFRIVLLFLRQTRDTLNERPLFVFVILLRAPLTLYPVAFVSLAYPPPSWVQEPAFHYSFADIPFMAGVGHPWCDATPSKDLRDECVATYFVGSACAKLSNLTEEYGYHSQNEERVDHSHWFVVETPTTHDIRLVGYLGPYNGVDLNDGAAFYGINAGTVTRIVNDVSLFDSFDFEVKVNTTLPVATVRCTEVEQEDVVSSLIIANTTYDLPVPIPLLYDEEIAGQVTADGRHLIFSFQAHDPDMFGTGHCAVGLKAWSGELVISGDPERGELVVKMTDNPWEWGPEERRGKLDDNSLELSVSEFGRLWLQSVGWSALPTPYALPMLLESDNPLKGPLVVNHPYEGNDFAVRNTAEFVVLSLLANSVGFAFGNESVTSPPEIVAPMAQREVRVRKLWYAYVQRGTWYWFWAFVLFVNLLFVIWSAIVILCQQISPTSIA